MEQCSHFLQSRDPRTGRMGCHMCRVRGSNSEAEAHKETASPPPSGTIFCLTCRLTTPCGNTVTGETIFDTKYECLKCGNFAPFALAFKTDG